MAAPTPLGQAAKGGSGASSQQPAAAIGRGRRAGCAERSAPAHAATAGCSAAALLPLAALVTDLAEMKEIILLSALQRVALGAVWEAVIEAMVEAGGWHAESRRGQQGGLGLGDQRGRHGGRLNQPTYLTGQTAMGQAPSPHT